jgi:hypothetical protein
MDDSYRLTLEETPDANDLDFVRERLNEFNRLHVEDDHHKPLTIFLRNHQGTIMAGLVGAIKSYVSRAMERNYWRLLNKRPSSVDAGSPTWTH